MKAYKNYQITKYQGEWLLYVYNEELKNGKWIERQFKTKKQALSHYKCFYAPMRGITE